MRIIFAIFLLFLSAICPTGALLGGTLAVQNEFRSLLLLKVQPTAAAAADEQIPVCGGVLIRSNYFLTAASCSFPDPLEDTALVYAGVHDSRYDEIEMQQKPLWHIVPIEMADSGLVLHHLQTDFETTPYVLPAILRADLPPPTSGVLPGWGSTNMHNNQPPIDRKLRKVTLDVITGMECDRVAAPGLGPRFCAGRAAGGAGGCGADLGSPLYCSGELCGILIQTGCGKPRSYDVYADVRMYVEAVEEAIINHSTAGKQEHEADQF